MKKIILSIVIVLSALSVSAQHRQMGPKEPVSFAKEKIAKIAKYVEVTKDDSTKLQQIFVDYQKEAQATMNDRSKLEPIIKGLQSKIESVLGAEKYKIYREKAQNDPANQRPMHR